MKNSWLKSKGICLLLCAVLIAIFLPVARKSVTAADDGSNYSIVFNDGQNDAAIFYYYIEIIPSDYSIGDRITVNEDGTPHVFTFNINAFYDEDDRSLAECGYGLSYVWLEDYDFFGDDSPAENIGRQYSYVYYLYSANENGEPLDEAGEVIEYPVNDYGYVIKDLEMLHTYIFTKAKVLAYTDPITLTSLNDHIETTINGVRYFAEYDFKSGSVIIMTEKELKGKLTIPEQVKIEGKTYPVHEIQMGVFAGQEGITSLKLPKSIRIIGDEAFLSTGLKRVNIPDNVREIGDYAFGYTRTFNEETFEVTYSKVPGFVVYAKAGSVGDDYAYDNGLKLITDKTAKAMKTTAKGKALKGRKVRISWSKKSYATGYQIYMSTKKTGSYKKVATIKKAGTVKWTSKQLAKKLKGKNVYYKVRPYTVVGDNTYYGKWSKIVKVKVQQ